MKNIISKIGINSLKEAANTLNIEIEKNLNPKKVLIVNIPINKTTFKGFRVQYGRPAKGGVRFHPNLTLKESINLAFLMTMKTACTNLPLSGAKGGINCNPKELSKKELENITRSFIRKIKKEIGPKKDILAPDVNTNSEIMSWIADEYGENGFKAVTGKAVNQKGSQGRAEATARGLVDIMICHFQSLKNKTVIIQGFGNVGFYTAKILYEEMGSKIIAVSDSKGATITKNRSLDPEALKKYKKENGSVKGYGTPINEKDLLKKSCDIFVPAAMENLIDSKVAFEIKAKTIFEGANGAITLEGEKILEKKNVFIVPDVIANSGGVIVSYLEMLQNDNEVYWSLEEVRKKLKKRITESYKEIKKIKNRFKVSMRTAAYMKALRKINNIQP